MIIFKDYLTVPSRYPRPPLLMKLKSPLQTDPLDTPPAPPDILNQRLFLPLLELADCPRNPSKRTGGSA